MEQVTSYPNDTLMLNRIALYEGSLRGVDDLLYDYVAEVAMNKYISPRFIAKEIMDLYDKVEQQENEVQEDVNYG